jgi:hypothetical protein
LRIGEAVMRFGSARRFYRLWAVQGLSTMPKI